MVGSSSKSEANVGASGDADGRLRIRAEDQTRERDADLRGADVAIERGWRLDKGQEQARGPATVLREPPDPAPAHPDRPELRRHVQRVGEDEQGADNVRGAESGDGPQPVENSPNSIARGLGEFSRRGPPLFTAYFTPFTFTISVTDRPRAGANWNCSR